MAVRYVLANWWFVCVGVWMKSFSIPHAAALWHKHSACEAERGLLWHHMTLPIVHLLHMSVKVELKHFTKNLLIKMTNSNPSTWHWEYNAQVMTTWIINKKQRALCTPLLIIQLNASKRRTRDLITWKCQRYTSPQSTKYSWTQHSGAELIYRYYFGMDKKQPVPLPRSLISSWVTRGSRDQRGNLATRYTDMLAAGTQKRAQMGTVRILVDFNIV